MKDSDIIELFCVNKNTELLDKLLPITKKLFIDSSYTCLFQKYGNIELAKKILLHYGEIKQLSNGVVYQGSYDYTGYQSLKRIGVVTIPILSAKDLPEIRKQFIQTLDSFPEYKRNPLQLGQDITGNQLIYVLGGFAALGNPASFHNDFVRNIRKQCREAVIPLFKKVIKRYENKTLRKETKLEMLFDRMMYRLVSQQPQAESWHRDVIPSKYIEINDEIFGGWINLDTENQYFSCIPGSHLGVSQHELDEGFSTIPEDEVGEVGKYRYTFPVPPGHVVIFPQYILHEVVSQKAKHDMMRLFIGWRLTVSNNYLHPETEKRMQEQAVMPLPSGQQPPMYSSNHQSLFRWKKFKPVANQSRQFSTIDWATTTFKDELLETKEQTKDRPAYTIIKRFLTSLEDYHLVKYKEYTPSEMALYLPQKITLDS
jgi:hypothetical protein